MMPKRKLHRRPVLRIGLVMWAVALALGLVVGALSSLAGLTAEVVFPYLVLAGPLWLVGFVLLVLATFLPKSRDEKPTFTEELLGREKLQYGVYTDGNWMSVLDDKEKKEKHHSFEF